MQSTGANAMQITTYTQLVNFVATNAHFVRVTHDNDDVLYNAALDFVLADAALYAIACEQHNEDANDAQAYDTVFEWLKDDVYAHKMFAV
jgi:hypothetical protein